MLPNNQTRAGYRLKAIHIQGHMGDVLRRRNRVTLSVGRHGPLARDTPGPAISRQTNLTSTFQVEFGVQHDEPK
jgi:hypothetical protein